MNCGNCQTCASQAAPLRRGPEIVRSWTSQVPSIRGENIGDGPFVEGGARLTVEHGFVLGSAKGTFDLGGCFFPVCDLLQVIAICTNQNCALFLLPSFEARQDAAKPDASGAGSLGKASGFRKMLWPCKCRRMERMGDHSEAKRQAQQSATLRVVCKTNWPF